MKRLNNTDFAYLAGYERQLGTLLHSHYLVGVGRTALDAMVPIYARAYGEEYRASKNWNCNTCVADFLRPMAEAYFREKTLREAAAFAKEHPATKAAPAKKAGNDPVAAAKAKDKKTTRNDGKAPENAK